MIRKLSLTAALGVALGLSSVAGVQAADLTYNTYLPAPHVLNKVGMEPFAERVARDSGGEVNFKLLTGGSVAKASAGLDVMRDGIVNSGLLVDLYMRKSLPLNTVISDLALLGTDPLVMVGAVSEYKLVLCEQCRKEMQRSSSIAMAFASTTPYTLMCKTKVDSLASMAGKKVRATGPWGVAFKEFGMVPVNVSSGETYEAMQRGQIDCTAGADAWLKSYTLWDVAKFVVDYPMGTYHGTLVLGMNADTWAGLSDKGRKAIVSNLPELAAAGAFGYEVEKQEARDGASGHGVAFVEPARDLVDALVDYQQKEIERVIKQAEGAGIKNAREEVQTFLKTIEKWQKIVDDSKRDRAAYVEALEREIYSKAVFK
ncbi:MAG: C4-dicarboxylate TRAP transporter substrate-binding protein [Burkholderiaceae bacterium]|nr:C4-dicarboxylate TRAP transporter substrate-binding protein [Burkholderiaceae bacterium]